jgi:hypothetical protein
MYHGCKRGCIHTPLSVFQFDNNRSSLPSASALRSETIVSKTRDMQLVTGYRVAALNCSAANESDDAANSHVTSSLQQSAYRMNAKLHTLNPKPNMVT